MTARVKPAPDAEPSMVAPVEPTVWEFSGAFAMEFCRHVRAVAIAASKDARRVLTAVRFVADGETLRMDATDSYRLYRIETPSQRAKLTALVPAAFLVRHLPKRIAATETLTLTFGDRFTIEFAGETYSCALIGGDYPNMDTIISDHEAQVTAEGHDAVKAYNPRLLVDIYKAAALVSDYYPVRVMAGLDPMKPTRFEQHGTGVKLTMLLMPVRP